MVLLAADRRRSGSGPDRAPSRSSRTTSSAAAVEPLTDRALLWGDDVLRAPDPVRRAVRHPAGLGRPADRAAAASCPATCRAALGRALPADERDVLDRLAGDRPVGHLPDGPADGAAHPRPPPAPARAAGPHRRAQRRAAARDRAAAARRLPLRPAPAAARAGAVDPDPAHRSTGRPPAPRWSRWAGSASCSPCSRRSRPACCAAAASACATRSGWPASCTWPSPRPRWLLELAYAAGLLDVGGPHRDEWLPTRGYDIWREQDLPDRWAVLAAGWLGGVRLPSLVGQRDVAGKAVNAALPRPRPAHRARHPPLGAGRPRRVPARLRAGRRRPGRAAALAHAPPGRPAGAGARHARRGRPARRPGRRGAVHRRPRPARRTARTAPPTACAACCPSRSTTCSPSPTSR